MDRPVILRLDDDLSMSIGESVFLIDDEAEIPVSLFVNLVKAHRVLKADSPRFRRRDEAKVAYEEDSFLVDCFYF